MVARITPSASSAAITTRLPWTSAVCRMVITHPCSLLLYLCPQLAHHMPVICDWPSYHSFSGVKPCQVILRDVLAPAATIRDSQRSRVTRFAYRLPRMQSIMSHLPHRFCSSRVVPTPYNLRIGCSVISQATLSFQVSLHANRFLSRQSVFFSTCMLPHSHSICHPTRSPAHFLLTPSVFHCLLFFFLFLRLLPVAKMLLCSFRSRLR